MRYMPKALTALIVVLLSMMLLLCATADSITVKNNVCSLKTTRSSGYYNTKVLFTLSTVPAPGKEVTVSYTITNPPEGLFSDLPVIAQAGYVKEGYEQTPDGYPTSYWVIDEYDITTLSGSFTFTVPESAVGLLLYMGVHNSEQDTISLFRANLSWFSIAGGTEVVPDQKTLLLYPNQSYQLQATQIGNTAFTYKSSNARAVSVTADGTVTAKKKGNATITIKGYGGKSAKVKVTVKAAPSIKLTETKTTLKAGQTYQLLPKVTLPSSATLEDDYSFTYQSSKSSVASVSDSGIIVAKKAGTATITIKCSLGSSKSFKVTVQKGKLTGTTYRAYLVGEIRTSSGEPLDYHIWNEMDTLGVMMMLKNLKDKYTTTTMFSIGKRQLLSDIPAAFAGADRDDVSLFFFGGNCDTSGALITSDGQRTTPAELYSVLNAIPGKVIVILSGSYSGHLISSGAQASDFTSRIISTFAGTQIEDVWSDVQPSSGVLRTSKFIVITACAKNEVAHGWLMYTLMPHFLARGGGYEIYNAKICKAYADANNDKTITLKEMITYLNKTIKDELIYEHKPVDQHVQCYPANANVALFHLK